MRILIEILPRPRLDIEVKKGWTDAEVSGAIQDTTTDESSDNTIGIGKASGLGLSLEILPEDVQLLFGEGGEDLLAPTIVLPLTEYGFPKNDKEDGQGNQETYPQMRLTLLNKAFYANERKNRVGKKQTETCEKQNDNAGCESLFGKFRKFCKKFSKSHDIPNT